MVDGGYRYLMTTAKMMIGNMVIGDMVLYPIESMYAIYGNICHPYTPNVSIYIYSIHGSYGYGILDHRDYGILGMCKRNEVKTIRAPSPIWPRLQLLHR